MAVKNYCTMNGQLIGEYEGTRSTDYILDGLGSVIATFRSTGTIQNQYRYSGYGQQVYRSGTGADPYFLWVGGWGYRTRGMVYVRRRTYYEQAAVWTNVGPLWPSESAYGYVGARPISAIDPTGSELVVDPGCKGLNTQAPDCCKEFLRFSSGGGLNDALLGEVQACMNSRMCGSLKNFIRDALKNIVEACKRPKGKGRDICFLCRTGLAIPPGCDDPCSGGGPGIHYYAYTLSVFPSENGVPVIGVPTQLCKLNNHPCTALYANQPCGCSIILCKDFPSSKELCAAVFHESIHCGGVTTSFHNHRSDCLYALSCCVCRALYGKNAKECVDCF